MSERKWEVGPVKLVNGSDAEILRINDQNNWMKYVGVRRVGLNWYPFAWDLYGIPSDSAPNENKLSLAPPPKKTMRFVRFVNVYLDDSYSFHRTDQEARAAAFDDLFATIVIDREVTEGEGLNHDVPADAENMRREKQ